MLEKEYPIPSEMLWAIWNERLRKINSDIKEYRITSIAVSSLIWTLILMTQWLSVSDKAATIVLMTLAVSGIIWALCYVYSVLPFGHYFDETPMSRHPEGMDYDSYAMLLKDIERTTYILSRRLFLIRKLIGAATLMTIMSILTFILSIKVVM